MKENEDYLHQLIAEGEHQQQDFKFEITSICKIARTLSAFANTCGGRLLIGVKDNGKIAGVRSEEEMYMVQAAGELYCKPQVTCRMTSYRVEGHAVVIAEVDAVEQKPVMAKLEEGTWRAFVRIADENIMATQIHLQLWKAEQEPQGALLNMTEKELFLLQLLATEPSLTLNRFCRKGHLTRGEGIHLLTHFIRFGLAGMTFENHQFYFTATPPKEEEAVQRIR